VRILLIFLTAAGATVVGLAVADNISDPPPIAPMALNSYTRMSSNMVSSRVFDADGNDVGTVSGIDLDQSGKPSGMEIHLSVTDHIIKVPASNVSYDEERHLAALGLTKAQIAVMDQAQTR
jgi:hypothetical protein